MSEIPIHERIRELQNSKLNEEQRQHLVNEAMMVLMAFADENDYILFPQTLDGNNYYSREEVENNIHMLKHIIKSL